MLFNIQNYKVSIITVINYRFSHASFFRTSSWKIRKGPIKPLLPSPKLWALMWSYPRDTFNCGDILGYTLQGIFFPHSTETQHVSWVPSSPIRGTSKVWSVAATWASQFYSVSSFKYFSAFMDKTHEEKENVSLAIGKVQLLSKCSRKGEFSNSVWCHGSILWPSGIW